jgi:transcriptional antiterminator RfaH
MMAWHVVVTRAQQEARAAIELTKQDFEVYMPILDSKPMFPRYIFTRFNREVDNWGVIRSTRGCIDLLKNGFLPAHVPQTAMDAIMAYRPPQEPVETESNFAPGDSVKIASGPLAGLQGLFVSDKQKRISCLLEIMGKRVEVPRDAVRAA